MNPRRLLLVAAAVSLQACAGPSILDQLKQARTFAKCEFRLASVDGTTLAGVPIQGKTAMAQVGAMDAIKLAAAFRSGALPLSFRLNVEAKNPNPDTAAMNRFSWRLFVDGQELTAGTLEERVEIMPNGGLTTFPLVITVDMRTALPGATRDAMVNLAFNVAGAGTRPTKLNLRATPTILISGQPMEFPDLVNITHEYGGK